MLNNSGRIFPLTNSYCFTKISGKLTCQYTSSLLYDKSCHSTLLMGLSEKDPLEEAN